MRTAYESDPTLVTDPALDAMPSKPWIVDGYRCIDNQIAYAVDRSTSVPYQQDYFDKYVGYRGTSLAKRINAVRVGMVRDFVDRVLDVGVGSGEFLEAVEPLMLEVAGYDINPVAKAWLRGKGWWRDIHVVNDDLRRFDGWTFWDVLEHLPDPSKVLAQIPNRAYLFGCSPVFETLDEVPKNKHFRPNEHYIYFTASGLERWLNAYRFQLLSFNWLECGAGRSDIGSFVFRKSSL